MDRIEKCLEIGRLLREVNCILKHSMGKRFESMGITMPQGMLLGILSRSGQRMKISELSQKLNLSDGTVSGIIDRLEKQGMVERARSDEDKRVVYVSLSPRMKEIHHDFHLRTEETVKSLLGRGTPEEIEKILEGLNILKKLVAADREH
jgi:DNA-binding MarR family transcriptional regulator